MQMNTYACINTCACLDVYANTQALSIDAHIFFWIADVKENPSRAFLTTPFYMFDSFLGN